MLKGVILGIALAVLAIVVCGYVLVSTASIPAAAAGAKPIWPERWAASSSLRANLARWAPRGPNPVPLTQANLVAGINLYADHCAICHGDAKGDASESPVAKGEYPKPPQLASHGVEDDPQGWTFWKIKYGIRWTGMPSWQDHLNDQQIWTLTLFLNQMDKLPPAAQQAWQRVQNMAGVHLAMQH